MLQTWADVVPNASCSGDPFLVLCLLQPEPEGWTGIFPCKAESTESPPERREETSPTESTSQKWWVMKIC